MTYWNSHYRNRRDLIEQIPQLFRSICGHARVWANVKNMFTKWICLNCPIIEILHRHRPQYRMKSRCDMNPSLPQTRKQAIAVNAASISTMSRTTIESFAANYKQRQAAHR